MATKVLIFYAIQLLASIYAMRRGGGPERIVAIAMIVAAVASTLSPFDPYHTFRVVNQAVLFIDLGLFFYLWGIAAIANRYWPMWIAAVQLVAVGIHAVRVYDPHIVAIAYGRLSGEIAYPMIAILIAGTMRHRRRLAAHGSELDWTYREKRRRLSARIGHGADPSS